MNIAVNARHMSATGAIRDYVQSKAGRLSRYYDNIQSVEVILDMEADQSVVEIVVQARRKHTFVAVARDDDMYAAIDQCMDKMTQQLRRHKDKVRDHQRLSHGEAQEMSGQ